MNYSKEELNEAYKKLPEELKEVFLSTDVTNSISSIGQKYNLHIDQIGELDSETGLVLLGLTHPTEFVSNLTRRLGVDRVIASQIASDINDQIFLKVRELLKDIQGGKAKEEENIEGEPRPSKDALLAAIEHPEGMLKRPVPEETEIPLVEVRNLPTGAPTEVGTRVGAEMGKDIPVVAPVPAAAKEAAEGFSEDLTLNSQKQAERLTPDNPLGDTTSSGRSDLQVPPVQTESGTDILTQKMSSQFSLPKVETKIEPVQGKKVDPYRELPD